MANTNDSQGHKDKNLDTSTKIFSQEMLMCEFSKIHYFVMNNVYFFLKIYEDQKV